MPDDRVILARVDLVEKVSNGLKVIKEDTIKCGNCKMPLLNITKVKEGKQKNFYIVGCPKCQDKSFKYLIEGKVCISPVEGLQIRSLDMEQLHDNVTNYNVEVIYERKL